MRESTVIDRQEEPGEDDLCVHRIEVEFAIPVYLPQGFMRDLGDLISAAVRLGQNQPVGGVHWVSGYGQKPLWSKADARFLGKTPADDAADSGEPQWDDSVYHIETYARPKTQKEKERDGTTGL